MQLCWPICTWKTSVDIRFRVFVCKVDGWAKYINGNFFLNTGGYMISILMNLPLSFLILRCHPPFCDLCSLFLGLPGLVLLVVLPSSNYLGCFQQFVCDDCNIWCRALNSALSVPAAVLSVPCSFRRYFCQVKTSSSTDGKVAINKQKHIWIPIVDFGVFSSLASYL